MLRQHGSSHSFIEHGRKVKFVSKIPQHTVQSRQEQAVGWLHIPEHTGNEIAMTGLERRSHS